MKAQAKHPRRGGQRWTMVVVAVLLAGTSLVGMPARRPPPSRPRTPRRPTRRSQSRTRRGHGPARPALGAPRPPCRRTSRAGASPTRPLHPMSWPPGARWPCLSPWRRPARASRPLPAAAPPRDRPGPGPPPWAAPRGRSRRVAAPRPPHVAAVEHLAPGQVGLRGQGLGHQLPQLGAAGGVGAKLAGAGGLLHRGQYLGHGTVDLGQFRLPAHHQVLDGLVAWGSPQPVPGGAPDRHWAAVISRT